MEKGENKPRLQWEIFEEENRRLVDSFELQDDASHDNDEDIEVETAEAPPEMLFPLLRYQKEWLAWALKQESSSFRGEILADETGMGKTIQAIALVLAKCAIKRSNAGTCNSSPTIVICPWAALKHWETEFTQCMPQGSVKVLVYHGAAKTQTVQDFLGYDFVLTTYLTVEAECRHRVLFPDKFCDFCGEELDRQNMNFHGRNLCQKSYEGTTRNPHEIHDNGGDRNMRGSSSGKKQDKARTGSSKLIPDDAKPYEPERKLLLSSVRWERIILDEAPAIKSRNSSTTKAILALKSTYKWALTCTPLENRVGETYSLALDHLYLVIYSKPKEALCDICKCVAKDLAVTSCGHTFCKGCLEDFTKIMDKSLCPTCSLSFTVNFEARKICSGQFAEATAFETSSILGRISPENFETSTKIEALGIRFSYRHAGEVIN